MDGQLAASWAEKRRAAALSAPLPPVVPATAPPPVPVAASAQVAIASECAEPRAPLALRKQPGSSGATGRARRGAVPRTATPTTRTRTTAAPHRIAILLTPSERALLARLHRCQCDHETPRPESLAATAAGAVGCCAEWPDDWRADNAKLMRRYRKDWAREAQTEPLTMEIDDRAAKAIRRLAVEMGWLLEDAARFAIRNLCDAYEDNFGLGDATAARTTESAAPPPAPAPASSAAQEPPAAAALALAPPRAPAVPVAPLEAEAPPPVDKLPALAPAVAPPAPTARPAAARPQATPVRPRAEAAPSPPRSECEQRAAVRPAAEEPPKPRVTHADIAGDAEVALIRRWQAGDRRAGNILLEAHERLILKMAMRYRNRGLDDDDLIQWARMGFLRAATKWNDAEGAKLGTYAVIWMKQHLQRAVDDQGADIRVPVHMHMRIRKERRAGTMSDEAAVVRLLLDPRSLDAPAPGHDDDGALLGELTADADVGPEDVVADGDAQERRRELIGRAMTWLTPQEQEVVRRMVLADDPETLEEVGASFDRTRERIRQIKVKALEKLERALRKLAADDDAVLWGAEPSAGPVRQRLAPQPPLTQPPAAEVAAPASDPLRAKPIQRPMPAAPRPTVEQIASFRPLKPPQKRASLELA